MAPKRPRDFLVVPKHFGKFAEVSWVGAVSNSDRDHLKAAQWQHLFVLWVREAMQYQELTPEDFASEVGISRQQVWRYFRGESPMPLVYFATAQRIFDVRLVDPAYPTPRLVGNRVAPGEDPTDRPQSPNAPT